MHSLFTQDKADAKQGPVTLGRVTSPLALVVRPSLDIPMGSSADWFKMGGGVGLGASYRLQGGGLALQGILDFSFIPDKADRSVYAEALRLGASYGLPIGAALRASLHAGGGWYLSEVNDFSVVAGGPTLSSGVELSMKLGSSLTLGVGADYKWLGGLYQGFGIALGGSIHLGAMGGYVDIPSIDLKPAFPVFFKHYDDHPLGTITVESSLKQQARDVTVRIFAKDYMDSPKLVSLPEPLGPKEKRTVDVFALFNDKVLDLTEGTKIAVEIEVEYSVEGQRYKSQAVRSLSLYGRNAMTWDDTRKAAAFVTAKEPRVLDLARSTSSFVRSRERRGMPTNLVVAMALHEALDLYGVNYATSPTTPYAELSTKGDQVDFLQFPRETLTYRAGDCSDLAILMAALLESVGVETAFVTVPGHIYIAFDSEVPVYRAEAELLDAGSYIPHAGRGWIPLEITLRGKGFLKAWELGAKEWNESSYAKEAGFFPVHEAWEAYQPVGLPGSSEAISMPRLTDVLAGYQAEMDRYLDKSLAPRIRKLEARTASDRSPPLLNDLAILYAKYGQLDKAEKLLTEATASRPYAPALTNLGNISFLRDDWAKALGYYKRALKTTQKSAPVLIALARTNRELRDFDEVKANLKELAAVDPELAKKYGFLGESKASSTRESSPEETRKSLEWDSEEWGGRE
jgi:tetratricopeptide (TPR) repeat protein